MKPGRAHGVRCAIYTRKSSDEGLEQSFNSLDAQREACGAYILSQASEGWSALREQYDDGGLSGGTLARPALQRLLGDIAAGKIDIVVVYKVDRLTRSLLDFAKLVEAFDKAGVEFVSITQSFNTTSSMGRLTLNMLLSFAQFEREVTAERIRDKIAASKARGMWMGGTPPIGYRPDGRSLAIVEAHAAFVRQVFVLYLECGNVKQLAETLVARGLHAPDRITSTGRTIGGRPLSRGQLQVMLKNRIFLGEIAYKDQVYPGLHPPVLNRGIWEQVQLKLASNLQGKRTRYEQRRDLLADKIVDGAGEPLIQTHSCKAGSQGKVRYRYYTSKGLQHGGTSSGIRIPAREIEGLVAERLAQAFEDPLSLAASAWLDVPADQLATFDQRGKELAAALRQKRPQIIAPVLRQVRVGERDVTIACSAASIADALGVSVVAGAPEGIELICDVRLRRSGMAMRLVHDNGAAPFATEQQALIRLILQARRWWAELKLGQINVTALAERQECTASYVTRVLRLAFLSPAIVEAIVRGKQPAHVDVRSLTRDHPLAAGWREQQSMYLTA